MGGAGRGGGGAGGEARGPGFRLLRLLLERAGGGVEIGEGAERAGEGRGEEAKASAGAATRGAGLGDRPGEGLTEAAAGRG